MKRMFLLLTLLPVVAMGGASGARLPEFVFTPPPFADQSDPKIAQLISRSAQLTYEYPAKARPLVVEALEMASKGREIEEYDYLYSLYLLEKNCFSGPDSAEFGPGTPEDYDRVAWLLLGLLEGKAGQWVFTPQGRFYLEAYFAVGNGLAWRLYEQAGEDPQKLAKALAVVQPVAALVDRPQYNYVLDTEVRILLKMGRSEEAYRIVHQVLARHPQFENFADIRKSAAYQTWLEELTAMTTEGTSSDGPQPESEVERIQQGLDKFNKYLAKAFDPSTVEWYRLGFKPPDSADTLAALGKQTGLPVPTSLSELLTRYGAPHSPAETDWQALELYSAAELLHQSTGLSAAIDETWGGRPELAEWFTPEQRQRIDRQGVVFGTRRIDDNTIEYLMYDAAGTFLRVSYFQDDPTDAVQFLTALLDTPPTGGSLEALLAEQLREIRRALSEE